MKIDTNRVAAYLAGNFPPYYEKFSKITFMKVLLREAGSIFPEKEEFNFINQHSSSLQVFFKECLSQIEQEDLLNNVCEELRIPFEARGRDFVKPVIEKSKDIRKEEKTIGFITPFDKKGSYKKLQCLIETILKELGGEYEKWKIKVSDFDIGSNKKILWDSIEDFLNRYPIYIANFRDKNLNVPLEVGYLIGKSINFIPIISKDEKISDLDGYIKIPSKKSEFEEWIDGDEVKEKQEKARVKFKNKIIEQLKRHINQ